MQLGTRKSNSKTCVPSLCGGPAKNSKMHITLDISSFQSYNLISQENWLVEWVEHLPTKLGVHGLNPWLEKHFWL